MGAIISRFRSDPYGATFEKHLDNIDKECKRLQAQKWKRKQKAEQISKNFIIATAVIVPVAAIYAGWVHRQPPGTFTWQQHALRVSPVLLLPLLLWLLRGLMAAMARLGDRWDHSKLQKLDGIKRKMIKDLKDSTRYERIHELINKYDPDKAAALAQQALAAAAARPGVRGMKRGTGSITPALAHATGSAAVVAASAAGAAGKAMMPLIDKLAAFVGDNPVLVDRLRHVQEQLQDAELKAQAAVEENARLLARVQELEHQLGAASAAAGAGDAGSGGEEAAAPDEAAAQDGAAAAAAAAAAGEAAMRDLTNVGEPPVLEQRGGKAADDEAGPAGLMGPAGLRQRR